MKGLPLSLLMLAMAAGGARAQTVTGTVHDEATERPIPGAFVVLLDSAGHRRLGVLTDSSGRYVLGAPQVGVYGVQASMIGYADAAPRGAELTAGTTVVVRFSLAPKAIPLAGIDVRAAPRCKLRSDTAGAEAAIWLQARKALALADWSAQESGLVMVTRRTEMSRSATPKVLGIDTVQGTQPFVTLPAERIREGGLIQPENLGYTYYAPGPEYVLSDDFLDGHCFAARLRNDEIGLQFVPVGKARQGDVRGTLWIDRKSSALRELEFEYVGVERRMLLSRGGGLVRFDRTPGGLWLITSWEVRLEYRMDPRKERHALMRITRGEILESWLPGQPGLAPAKPPT